MSKLSYRTVAGQSPLGKSKVYFSCYPEDFENYFEEYALKILHIQDCAIWYEAEPEADYDREDLELNLSQMQLFIMPVTTKLLTIPNRAMDIEFTIAQEKHIPVLPLMMERSLDDVFLKRFGDLQYLDPDNHDETRRSLDEVLETYIRSVLVSSDLADKVRAAFGTYIFLSYRKKDRKKAQELMRLIHRNPFCRDIAIWYDEFLTPGEDFNQEIEEMLEKSDLFTLVVTPNLVNETNYVMIKEYPFARKQEKLIFPVEMEETDRDQLEKYYESLPPCIRGEESEMFQEALLERIRELAVMEINDDPEHNFLIGLAYLDGIDVEVDSERALELIRGAAEAGVLEAMSLLFIMYETGKGTERSYLKGIEWRKRQIELLRKKYKVESTEENVWELIRQLYYLGNAQYEHRILDAAEASYNEMCFFAEEMIASGNKHFQRHLSIGYGRLGDIARVRGDFSVAQAYYEKSYAIDEEQVKKTGTVKSRRDLSISYKRLGDIAQARGELSVAQAYYEKSFAIDEVLVSVTGKVESYQDLSISYEQLGDIAQGLGELSVAQAYYEKGHSICKELVKETGTVKSRRDLSVSYGRLGDIAQGLGELFVAQAYYEKGHSICKELAKETGTVESRRDLSISYGRLGDIAQGLGELSVAQAYYEKSYAIDEELVKETGTVESRKDLSVSYGRLGDITKALGELSMAQAYYEKSHYIDEEIFKKTKTVESRRNLFVCYIKLGDIAQERGEFSVARIYYEKGLSISKELAKETGTVESRRNLSVCYTRLGDIARKRREFAEAQKHYEKCLAISEKLGKQTEMETVRQDLSVIYYSLGDFATIRRNLSLAQAYYEKALAISKEMVRETGTLEAKRILAHCCLRLGILYYIKGDNAESKKSFRRVQEVGEGSDDIMLNKICKRSRWLPIIFPTCIIGIIVFLMLMIFWICWIVINALKRL